MNKKIIKRIGIGTLSIVVIFALLLNTNIIKLPLKFESHLLLDYNPDDDRELVGISHNVFVGKVMREMGSEEADIGIVTKYEIEPIYNVKGELNDTLILQQQGGYKNGILYTIHDGDVMLPDGRGESLLEPGTTYLFATRSTPGENLYYMLSHSRARKIISQDPNLSLEELKVLAERDQRVKELEEAYKNEILNESDVLNGYTRNTYESLQKESSVEQRK